MEQFSQTKEASPVSGGGKETAAREVRSLTCIGCPLGCTLTVELENGQVESIAGSTCRRGDDYARKEVTNPTRIITSTVRVTGGAEEMVSVKTRTDIPRESIARCVKALKGIEAAAPVRMGEVILENAAGTGVDVIATKEIAAENRLRDEA